MATVPQWVRSIAGDGLGRRLDRAAPGDRMGASSTPSGDTGRPRAQPWIDPHRDPSITRPNRRAGRNDDPGPRWRPALFGALTGCVLVCAVGAGLFGGSARADTGEGSIRPLLEARNGATLTTDPALNNETAVGGGVMVTYGLSFSWSVSAVYQIDATTILEAPDPTDPFQRVRRWRSVRHATRVGFAWAPSDELTPVLLLDAGAAILRTASARRLRRADGQTEKSLPADQRIVPTARATALYEWRFTDFWSVAAGGFIEHAGSPGFGTQVWLATYRYL